MKRCVIFGGGQIGDPEQIKNLVRQEDYLICADSGYRHCVQLGFSPQLVLGDFDSYAGVVQSDCELLRYPIEKDDTDTMLAVKQALQRGYERLVLVGMLGGRLDRHPCQYPDTGVRGGARSGSTDYRQQLLYHRHQGRTDSADSVSAGISLFGILPQRLCKRSVHPPRKV